MTTSAARKATIPVIRRAAADDLAACAEIINDYVDATPWLPRTVAREEIAAMFGPDLLERRTIFVAEEAGDITGYVSLNPAENFLVALYLVPAARARGTGKALMDAAKAECPGGFDLTVFEPNTDAQRFYRREGFAEVPEGRKDDTEEGVPTLLMRWAGTGRADEG